MIRKIHNYCVTFVFPPTWITFTSPVDPNKCVVLFQGAGYYEEEGLYGTNLYAYAFNVYPILASIHSSSMLYGWAIGPVTEPLISFQIVEYI